MTSTYSHACEGDTMIYLTRAHIHSSHTSRIYEIICFFSLPIPTVLYCIVLYCVLYSVCVRVCEACTKYEHEIYVHFMGNTMCVLCFIVWYGNSSMRKRDPNVVVHTTHIPYTIYNTAHTSHHRRCRCCCCHRRHHHRYR